VEARSDETHDQETAFDNKHFRALRANLATLCLGVVGTEWSKMCKITESTQEAGNPVRQLLVR